jgi:hypothetical protein
MRNDYKIRPRLAFKGGGIAERGFGRALYEKGSEATEKGSEATEKEIKIKGTTDTTVNAIKKAASSTIPAMIAKKIVETVKNREGKKKGGIIKKAFPDLTGDGKVTFKDVLKGRGVIKKKGGIVKKGKK